MQGDTGRGISPALPDSGARMHERGRAALDPRTSRPNACFMAKAKTSSIKKLRKRTAKKARKLTKKAHKLSMHAAAAAKESLDKKRKSSKGKKADRTAVTG
jgi:adenylosuccinate synthase